MNSQRSMRILCVCSYYKPAYVYGGPVNSSAALNEGLTQAGAQVTVFTTNANRSARLDVPLQEPVNINGVTVWYFPLVLNGLSYFYSPSLAEAISVRVSEFDLVVANTLWGHALIPTATACAHFLIPYVVAVHGQLNRWALANKGLKKSIYLNLFGRRYVNHAAALHCTDPIEAEAVERLGFRPPTFVVPFAVHYSSYDNAQEYGNFRQRFGIPDQAYVLLFLGRIAQIKRPDIAVDTLGAAQSLNREIHLVIVGPDEDRLMHQLKAQAQNLGCDNKLHFTGLLKKEAVVSALAEANLLLMPSEIQENFGMAALEAMAAGVPILVSEGVPVGRWAQMADAGRTVACTKDAFQQAALELLSRPEQLRIMGQRGQGLVREYFDVSVVARQMLAQYQAIVTTGRPLPRAEFAFTSNSSTSLCEDRAGAI
jgi:glycosyltransferase involved in cell wall biosynthesis